MGRMHGCLKNRKGTTMVEAVIYLPIVIISVVALLNLGIQMYDKITVQAANHVEKRMEARGNQADFARKIDFAEYLVD